MRTMLSRQFFYSRVFTLIFIIFCSRICNATIQVTENTSSHVFNLLDEAFRQAKNPFAFIFATKEVALDMGFSSEGMKNLVIIGDDCRLTNEGVACESQLFQIKNSKERSEAAEKKQIIPLPQEPTVNEAIHAIINSEVIPGTKIQLTNTTKWFFKQFFTAVSSSKPYFNIEKLTTKHQTMVILSFLKLADNPIFRQVLWALLVYRQRVLTSTLARNSWAELIDASRLQRIETCWYQAHTITFEAAGSFEYKYDSGGEHTLTFTQLEMDNFRIKDQSQLQLPTLTRSPGAIDKIQLEPIPFELALAHELLHALHFLMNPYRFLVELNVSLKGTFDRHGVLQLNKDSRMDYYQQMPSDVMSPMLSQVEEQCETLYARIWNGPANKINFNEYRVIIGEPFDRDNILASISENVLRLLWGVGIRIGLDSVPQISPDKDDRLMIITMIKQYATGNLMKIKEYYRQQISID